MINENIKDLILAIAEGNSVSIEDNFNAIMASKISDRLDDLRIDVAGSMFNSQVVEESYELDDYSLEEIEEFMMSEEFEQLDEVSKATLGSYVKRASSDIASSARSAGEQLGQGAGKDKEKYNKYEDKAHKRQVGIATAVSKLTKEEVALDEDVEMIKHPVGQHPKGIGWTLHQAGEQTGKDHSVWKRTVKRVDSQNTSPASSTGTKAAGLAKEEVALDEVSKQTLASYVKSAQQDREERLTGASFRSGKKGDAFNTADETRSDVNRARGINRALDKMSKTSCS